MGHKNLPRAPVHWFSANCLACSLCPFNKLLMDLALMIFLALLCTCFLQCPVCAMCSMMALAVSIFLALLYTGFLLCPVCSVNSM